MLPSKINKESCPALGRKQAHAQLSIFVLELLLRDCIGDATTWSEVDGDAAVGARILPNPPRA
jgi:hypothetical protein